MRLLVVGGGITGLAAAWEAVHSGTGSNRPEVLLVEAGERLGGKLHTERIGPLLIEHGPDSFVSYRPAALELIGQLGLGSDVIGISGTRTVHIRARGKLRSLPAGMGMVLPNRIGPFVTTGLLSPIDKVRAGLDLVLPRQLQQGQDIAIGAFLRRRLGAGIVRRFADPMVGGIYGAGVDELSLDAVLPSLRTDENTHRSLMLAAIDQGRQARTAGRGPSSPFRTLRGGLATMVDALAEQLAAAGVDLRTGVTVTALRPCASGATQADLSNGESHEVDAVVLAAGVQGSAQVLAEAAPAAASALAEIPLATSTVVTLAYRATCFPAPVTSHGWLEGDSAPISGITVSSAKWQERAPADMVLIRAFVPGRLGAIASAPDAELVPAVRDHVESVLRAHSEPEVVRVSRWPAMMPKYTVGHLDRVRRVEQALSDQPRWRVAGSSLRGVGVPDCIADGRRQAGLALDNRASAAGRVAG